MNDDRNNTSSQPSEDTMNYNKFQNEMNTSGHLVIGPYTLLPCESGNITCHYSGNLNRVLWVTDDFEFAVEKAMRYFN